MPLVTVISLSSKLEVDNPAVKVKVIVASFVENPSATPLILLAISIVGT